MFYKIENKFASKKSFKNLQISIAKKDMLGNLWLGG